MACATCSSSCTCAVVGSVGTTVTGDGSAANPYTVTSIPFTGVAGAGIAITAGGTIGHSPTISTCISTDTGNSIVYGADGCLYVPTNLQTPAVANTNSINLTLTGTTITADIKPACGLIVTAAGVGVATSGTWGFPCADTNGAPIYCDAAGQLRADPEKFVIRTERLGAAANILANAAGVGSIVACSVDLSLTNPSPCRSMIVQAQYGYGVGATSGGVPICGIESNFTITGSPGYNGKFVFASTNPSTDASNVTFATRPFVGKDYQLQSSNFDGFTIGPGATVNINVASVGIVDCVAGSSPDASAVATVAAQLIGWNV